MSVVEQNAVAGSEPVGDSSAARRRPSARWRRIVGGVALLVVLSGAIAGGVWLKSGDDGAGPSAAGTDGAVAATAADDDDARAIKVVLGPVRRMTFERSLRVQGNVEAKRIAMVSPRIAGALDTIFVDEGDTVEAGRTRLFQTDPVRLSKTVEVRRHEVDVAEHTLREKRASVERYEADYEKAEYDLNRQRELLERMATSNDELEDAETEYRVNAALLKHAQAQVDLAQAQLEQSRSALAIAQKDLDDSLIVSPINGRVARRYQEPGEMGSPGSPVLRIEDPSLVEVSVYLPARAYGEVIPDETMMTVTVGGVDLGLRPVAYKSPTIDAQLRTFEARCLLHDPPAAVAPGAMAQVRVVLERREGLGVPREAIQNRREGTVIFAAHDGKARRIPVRVGLEMDGVVEVVAEQLDEAEQVVVVGGYFLNADTAIAIVREKP